MKSRWLQAAAGCTLLFALQDLQAQALNWGEEYARRVKATENVSPLGDELFGDDINLFNGTVSFSATDVALPGNDSLAVEFRRIKDLRDASGSRPMADWDIDAPHLTSIHPDRHADGYWAPLARCSTVAQPPTYSVDPYDFLPSDYWSGTQLRAGGASGDLLTISPDQKLVKPTGAYDYRWTSKGQWFFSCLDTPLKSGHPGQGFVGHAPDGKRYFFDFMSVRPYPGISKKDPSRLQGVLINRYQVRLYATRVEDRFGNWVQYDWTNDRLNRIWSNDGREITIVYGENGWAIAVTAGNRTWSYQYADSALRAVVLPDGSRWQFAAEGPGSLTRVRYEYDAGSPDPNDYARDDTNYCWPTNVIRQLDAKYAITHPSGATAQFTFAPLRHGRTNVPYLCIDGVDDDWRTDYNAYALTHDAVSIREKVVSGPGLVQQRYTYAYSGLEGGYRPEDSQTDAITGATPPPHYKYVVVTEPDGTEQVHRFGKDYELNEGRLLSVETRKNGVVYRTLSHDYVTEPEIPSMPFPDRVGFNLVAFGDSFSAGALRPIRRTTISLPLEAATFRNQADGFDAQARVASSTKSSSTGHSKHETSEHHDDRALWVLGQIKRQTTDGIETARTEYDARALPVRTYAFGKLQQTLGYYADGTLATQEDGNGNLTRYSNWKRGIPRSIRHPGTPETVEGGIETAEVDDNGWIVSTINEVGAKACYGYDPMGRLASIHHPDESAVGTCDTDESDWKRTSINFSNANTPATYGLPAGHWRQTVNTGNARKLTYFDALWRPLIEESFDAANPGDTRSISVTRYDTKSRPVFRSYPQRALTDYATVTQGSRTIYDALGRTSRTEQDSEIGVLTTTIDYLPGFVRRTVNPRGYETTERFQAFDTPSHDAPISIQTQESTTTIVRDVFGKPLSMTKSEPGG